MLRAAGIAFEARPANVDERALEAALNDASPGAIAVALAEAKAQSVSQCAGGKLVLGSDSLIAVGGTRYDKPVSREDAVAHLRAFSGQEMELHSAAALARDGKIVWKHGDVARLQVRHLSNGFIDHYLDQEWPEVSHCAGVFRIEAMGVHLFERIAGNHFTVLGMPLLPLLGALRNLGEAPQ